MNEERSSGHTPAAFTSFSDEATPSTSREGATGTSSTLHNYARISDEVWAYPWNRLNSPTDATYITGHPDINENGSTAYRLLSSSSGDNDANLSTTHAGMEESSAILEDYARIPVVPWDSQRNTQYYRDEVTFTSYGHTDIADNGSTGYRPPVSSSGGDDAVPSTSRAGTQEASASLATNRRCATGTDENELQELCGVCGKVYTRLRALHRHAAEHYGDESYICEACYSPSVTTTKSVTHCQKSTGEKLYKCETCGKSFKRPWNLHVHLRTHTGIKSYNCETCGKSFARLDTLDVHKRTHTGATPYKCETCGKSFKHSGHLNVHQRTHTGMKPYKCETCGESFKQWAHLNLHQHTHSGIKRYNCKACGKSFTRFDHLKKHQLKHAGEKSHVCPKYTKSFQSKHYLKEHINLHTGAKPFVCEICSKSFRCSTDLGSHRLRHADESPHQSAQCSTRFSERESLDGHMCEMVTCYLCGDSFSDAIQLAIHLVTHRDG